MILEEIKHVIPNVIRLLPGRCNGLYGLIATNHLAHGVIHTYLVIEVVEACTQIVAILCRIIDLANEDHVRISKLHLVGSPVPEFSRHHLSHIAAEAVDALPCPEEQYVGHFAPRVRDWSEMPYPTCIIVDTIVQLHRLVPVVHAWRIVETVVTCSLGR